MYQDLGELDYSFLNKIVPFLSNNHNKVDLDSYMKEMANTLLLGFVSEKDAYRIKKLDEFLGKNYPELTYLQYKEIELKFMVKDFYPKFDANYNGGESSSINDDGDYPPSVIHLDIQDLYDTLLDLGVQEVTPNYSVNQFLIEYYHSKNETKYSHNKSSK